MLVNDFIDNQIGGLPEGLYESLPRVCPDCGFPMEMSEALTQLHCSNNRCPSKIAQRLVALATMLGVKDMGASRAEKFVKTHNVTNPLYIFKYNPDTDGAMGDNISLDTSKKIHSQFLAKNKFTLSEYIKAAQLPFIQGSANHIFGKFDDLTEAYKEIDKNGVQGITKNLDIKADDEDISIRALKVYQSLSIFRQDLFNILPYVEIVKVNNADMIKIEAVCSTEVGAPYRTKADFYSAVNNMFSNIHINFGSSVTKKTQYLIWGGSAETNKVKKARAYNKQFEDAGSSQRIEIMDAQTFIEKLKSMQEI